MKTKLVKDLQRGDAVKLSDPDGTAKVMDIRKSRLFQCEGGCFELDLKVISGPHKGKSIKNQAYPGASAVELAPL